MSLEQPDYTVVHTDEQIEYRQYDSYLVAETFIENADADASRSFQDAGTEGFRRLFRYISGANLAATEIAMTAPVEQARGTSRSEKISMTTPVSQEQDADGWRVSFMLPKEYTLASAPVPQDRRVQIREVQGRLVAVLRYSGRWTGRNFEREKIELLDLLEQRGIEVTDQVQSAFYNAPYVPPFMRRNEVLVPVRAAPTAIAANDVVSAY